MERFDWYCHAYCLMDNHYRYLWDVRPDPLFSYVFAWLAFPLLGPLLGRSGSQAEIFGMAPDPTALATLGILLLCGKRPLWWLFPIPAAWCLISGATLWAMDAPDFVIAPLAALLAIGLAAYSSLKHPGSQHNKEISGSC